MMERRSRLRRETIEAQVKFSNISKETILLDPLRSMDNNRTFLQVNGAIRWV